MKRLKIAAIPGDGLERSRTSCNQSFGNVVGDTWRTKV